MKAATLHWLEAFLDGMTSRDTHNTPDVTPDAVLCFWEAAGPERWWQKNAAFDEEIRRRFGTTIDDSLAGKLALWAETARGALALILLLDQFPRNIFRDSARQFAGDDDAFAIADEAIAEAFDSGIAPGFRMFFYMPLQHS